MSSVILIDVEQLVVEQITQVVGTGRGQAGGHPGRRQALR